MCPFPLFKARPSYLSIVLGPSSSTKHLQNIQRRQLHPLSFVRVVDLNIYGSLLKRTGYVQCSFVDQLFTHTLTPNKYTNPNKCESGRKILPRVLDLNKNNAVTVKTLLTIAYILTNKMLMMKIILKKSCV